MKINVKEFLKPCSCGKKHEIFVDDIIIESKAIEQLPSILQKKGYQKPVMLCDENTYQAAGKKVEELIPNIKKIMLSPKNLHADEHGVKLAEDGLEQAGDIDLMIAVGSGTIHDITRYHAYHKKVPFFSVPTAASVDGFVSTVAAMTWKGCKKSMIAVSPIAVIADTDIFKKAPIRLTASGVSDLLGKYTALADWKIAHILADEYICEEICAMEYQALDRLKQSLDGLLTGDTDAYENLMYGLLLSGLAMQMTGNSRPASGAEHHMSHLWEMEVINDFIDFYHGEKVGVGLVLTSKIYHNAADCLRNNVMIKIRNKVMLEEPILRTYFKKPGMLEMIMEENTPNILEKFDSQRLLESKDAIADIIDEIPTGEELIAMIKKVNGVSSLEDLGLDKTYQVKTARLSPYVRSRLTYMRALKFYDFYEEIIFTS